METKTIINDAYNAAVLQVLLWDILMSSRKFLKMTPPSLTKMDLSDAGKLVLVIGASSMTKDWMVKMKYIPAVDKTV